MSDLPSLFAFDPFRTADVLCEISTNDQIKKRMRFGSTCAIRLNGRSDNERAAVSRRRGIMKLRESCWRVRQWRRTRPGARTSRWIMPLTRDRRPGWSRRSVRGDGPVRATTVSATSSSRRAGPMKVLKGPTLLFPCSMPQS